MKLKAIAVFVVAMLGIGSAQTLPVPMITYPNDTVFIGTLRDTLWSTDDSATVYYKTDGSDPGIGGPFVPAGVKWTFSFDSTVTLKAFAWRRLGSGVIIYSNNM